VFDFEWRRIEELGAREFYLYAGRILKQRDTQCRRMSAETNCTDWQLGQVHLRSNDPQHTIVRIICVCFKFVTGIYTRVQYRS